jgi:hypothetical protein
MSVESISFSHSQPRPHSITRDESADMSEYHTQLRDNRASKNRDSGSRDIELKELVAGEVRPSQAQNFAAAQRKETWMHAVRNNPKALLWCL